MPEKEFGPADREEARRLQAGLSAIGGNCFWQWFRTLLEERTVYLQQRLARSSDWSQFRYISGQLGALQQLLGQIREIERSNEEGRDEDEVFRAD